MNIEKKMQALWLENKKLEFRNDISIPVAGDGEALILVHLTGVCRTDLELVRGYYPFKGIPGHEFVGEVIMSEKNNSWIGKRVVGEINIGCGVCEACQKGLSRHCENRRTLGIHDWEGVFAEYIVLPISNLHEVPAHLPDEVAVFTEPLAAAFEILEQIHLEPSDSVLIIGAGRLGQLIAQVLQGTGCHLEVFVRHTRQRELLAKRDIQIVTEQEVFDSKYDTVIEATGSPDGFALARSAVRPRGRIILKSTYKGDMRVNLSQVVVDEITLIGSRCGPFDPALKLLGENKVDPRPLIEAVYPLEQGVNAFEHATRPGIFKVLIKPGAGIFPD